MYMYLGGSVVTGAMCDISMPCSQCTPLVFSLKFLVQKNLSNQMSVKLSILLVIFAKVYDFYCHFRPFGATNCCNIEREPISKWEEP